MRVPSVRTTASGSTSATPAPRCRPTPRRRSSSAAYRRSLGWNDLSTSPPRWTIFTSNASPWISGYAGRRPAVRSSASAPATSTPVAPPPTTTTRRPSSLPGFAAAFSRRMKSVSRIFMAWDREYMGNEFSLAPGCRRSWP